MRYLKFFAVTLALVLCLSSAPAFAEDENTEQPAPPEIEQSYFLDLSQSGCRDNWYAWTWSMGVDGRWVSGTMVSEVVCEFKSLDDNVLFARMKEDTVNPSWEEEALWKQTVDIKITDEYNCFVISGYSSEEPQKLSGYFRNYGNEPQAPTDPSNPTTPTSQYSTEAPTQAPTSHYPSTNPTQTPTSAPTQAPTHAPTSAPTQAPTVSPTEEPKPSEKGDSELANLAKLNLRTATVKCGKVITLKVYDAHGKKISFKSSNSAVASVSQTGKVSALKKGFAKITVKVGSQTEYCTIKVTTSPKLSKTSLRLKRGKTRKITITGKVSTVKNNYSSNRYAKIMGSRTASSFKITGKRRGLTYLKVRVNGVLFKIKVRVI